MKHGWVSPISEEETVAVATGSPADSLSFSHPRYSESQVNDVVTVMCKVTVDGVDTIAAMMGMPSSKHQRTRRCF